MSVRTISQLSRYELSKIIGRLSSDENFRNSLLELSYYTSEGKYESKNMSLGDWYDYVYYNILSGGENDSTTFNTYVNFNKLVKMYAGLELSGNFFVNKDIEDEDLTNYQTYIKNGNNTIYAVDTNTLISPETLIKSTEIKVTDSNDTELIEIDTNSTKIKNKLETGEIEVNGRADFNDEVHGGQFYGEMFNGTALRALWADLAETYESDKVYNKGTLIKFGGEKEITIANDKANGVITSNPGFILNSGMKGCQIALIGRTPVRIIGSIRKFENVYLCPFKEGVGASESYIREHIKDWNESNIIGKSLQENNIQEEKLVECVVELTLK